MAIQKQLRAVASDKRWQILRVLKEPAAHFPPPADGDLEKDGVSVVVIARKLKISQPTATEHLRVLHEAGLLRVRRRKQWTFYRRNETAIAALKRELADTL